MAESVWTKLKPKKLVLKTLPQSGKRVSVSRDLGRKAKLPGKRISKTGKAYWETRKNRSDIPQGRL